MRYLKLIIIFFVFYISSSDNHIISIEACLNKFKRPFTVLEIGITNSKYSFSISKKYDVTTVLMLLGTLPHTYKYSIEDEFKNLIILNPNNFNFEDLTILTRCEHFDVVIIRGVPNCLKKSHDFNQDYKKTIDLFLKLGDITFLEVDCQDFNLKDYCHKKNGLLVSKSSKSDLYNFNIPKPGLDIARWVLKHLPVNDKPRYPILSNFDKKVYFKGDQEILWHKGINFSTFVMLRGICPCEKNIRKNLESMRSLSHNDLIIGNMVIQGKEIVVIDVNDPRWDADVQHCIDAALIVFDGGNYRLRDPENCLLAYRKFLSKK